jgi:hypothetical protein
LVVVLFRFFLFLVSSVLFDCNRHKMSDPAEGSAEWIAQDKGPSILAVCWTMTGISTVFVVARLSVRGLILRQLRSDDYFTVLALVSLIPQSMCNTG